MAGITNPDDINPNSWYQLCTGTCDQSLFGSEVYAKSGSTGAAFCTETNTTSENQRWQLLKLNASAWTIRSQKAGADVYLGAAYDPNEETEGNTTAVMLRGDVADASVYWNIGPWGDTTWYFTNLANGTNHLVKKPNSLMAMTPNISAPAAPGQKWHVKKIVAINDKDYSSVNLVGATFATATTLSDSVTSSATATPTSSTDANANANNSPLSGLSTGARAGIGAGVGLVVLIALVVLGLLLRKRKRRQLYTNPPQEVPNDMIDSQSRDQASPFIKYELSHGDDNNVKYELPYNNTVSEVPLNERPAELPAHTVQR